MKVTLKWVFNLVMLLALLLVNVFASDIENSDENIAHTAFYIELGGEGIGLSANIDYRFHPNYTFRVGGSLALLGYSIPVTFSYLTHPISSHHLETGIGAAYGEFASLFGTDKVSVVYLISILGYRYQPKKGGFLFRVSLTPLILSGANQYKILPMAGISFGYCFK